MQNFVDTLSWCDLCDLKLFGPKFTWLYQQDDGSQIRERLVREVTVTPQNHKQ